MKPQYVTGHPRNYSPQYCIQHIRDIAPPALMSAHHTAHVVMVTIYTTSAPFGKHHSEYTCKPICCLWQVWRSYEAR